MVCGLVMSTVFYQFVVVKRKFNDSVGIAAVVDGALQEEEAGAVVVQEGAGVGLDLFIDLVDQLVKLLLLRRSDLQRYEEAPLARGWQHWSKIKLVHLMLR